MTGLSELSLDRITDQFLIYILIFYSLCYKFIKIENFCASLNSISLAHNRQMRLVNRTLAKLIYHCVN